MVFTQGPSAHPRFLLKPRSLGTILDDSTSFGSAGGGCRKNLPLAATPQMPQTVTIKSESGVTLLATLHGESRNAIIRISPDVADPEFALDNHAPAADLGYLWFRDVHDWPMISGSLDVLVASTADAAERVVYSLLERLLETSEQVHCRIQLVEPKHTLVQTGEGEIFADGRA